MKNILKETLGANDIQRWSDLMPRWGCLVNGPLPAYFSFIWAFSTKHYNFYNKLLRKTSIQNLVLDLNPRPLEHESPPITTTYTRTPASDGDVNLLKYLTFVYGKIDGDLSIISFTNELDWIFNDHQIVKMDLGGPAARTNELILRFENNKIFFLFIQHLDISTLRKM